MTFYFLLVQPNVDVVVLPVDPASTTGMPDVFVTTDQLHKKAYVGEIASRFSTDFTSASAGTFRSFIDF